MKFLKGLGWREWLLFAIPLGLLALPVLLRFDYQPLNPLYYPIENSLRGSCQERRQILWKSIAQYAQDYDGKLPLSVSRRGQNSTPAGSPKLGWEDTLGPYVGGEYLFLCSKDNRIFSGPHGALIRSVYFNGNLYGKRRAALPFPASTLLVGEGDDGKDIADTHYSKTSLPLQWLIDESSPAYRHLGGAVYLMADGSVHWLHPDEVTTFGGRKNSFAVK